MGKNHKTFKKLMREVFSQYEEANLSLQEIAKSIDIDKKFLEALLDDENPMIDNLNKFIKFSNIKFTTRKYKIRDHIHKDLGDHYYIHRRIFPKATIRLDKTTGQFYGLIRRDKHKFLSPSQKDVVMYDFQNYRNRRGI